MQTRVIRVDAARPEPQPIAETAAIVRGGGLVAFPTETVYGLGADARSAEAVARIYAAKGRPPTNPLIVHLADLAQLDRVAAAPSPRALRLARQFWPGPLTLVLGRGPEVTPAATADRPTVAVRIPAHPVALALLAAAAIPLAAPSANRSMAISPTTAEHVLKGLEGRIDAVLDAGPAAGGIESTVLDLTSEVPRILRPGPISADEIAAAIGGPVAWAAPHDAAGVAALAPGRSQRHYAPCARLELAPGGAARVERLLNEGERVGWLALACGEASADWLASNPRLHFEPMPAEPRAYAARLYAALHACDDWGATRIVVDRPPSLPAWRAVCDRLSRAAAGA